MLYIHSRSNRFFFKGFLVMSLCFIISTFFSFSSWPSLILKFVALIVLIVTIFRALNIANRESEEFRR